jgi:hypothetical protein
MKSFLIISFIFAALILLNACKTTKNYPELSTALTDSLKQTDIPGVFMAATGNIQPRPFQPPPPCPRLCGSTTIYWVQVIYPITICNPPDFSNSVLASYKLRSQDSLIARISSSAPVTRMVSKKLVGGYKRLYCKTMSGPWIAEIEEKEMCDNSCGVGTRRFSMTILGVPEKSPPWVWWDSMDNHPQDVKFVGQPWIRSVSMTDCDPSDLTDCK